MTEQHANGMKRRKKPGKKSPKKQGSQANKSNKNAKDKDIKTKDTTRRTEAKLSLSWAAAKNSPMFWMTAIVMIPYALYNFYLYVFLQHPEIISIATLNLYKPRPALNLTDLRQVLIVGTISSGTTQVSHDLSKQLGLEIGHENAETAWSFVRDGTVSWFHGVRYIPRPGIDTEKKNEWQFQHSVDQLCKEIYPHMGFHPLAFRSGRCNVRQSWDSCWKDECKEVLKSEWGCALDNKNNNSSHSCVTPFHKVLHQVRHPLRTIESLVTKFCINGIDGKVQPVFITFAQALFPQIDFSTLSCVEAAGYYVDKYNTAMMNANLSDMFRVEEKTPCDIAQMAGFTSKDDDVVFRPNKDRISNICNDKKSEANEKIKSTRNTYNSGKFSLTIDGLLGGAHGSSKAKGDRDLQKRIIRLIKKLGYTT